MYEMQRPRPVLRSRPADFSASIAPLDHLPGPATLPVVRLPGSPAGFGTPLGRWPGNYPSPKTLSFPKAQRLQVFPVPWLRAFFSPHDPGFPPRSSNSSFPFAEGGSELSFSPHGSGFPLRQLAQSFPFAGGARLLLARRPGFALCRVAPGSSLARGLGITQCRVARSFPRAGWLGVSSSPTAPGFSWPEGPDLPFAGWLEVSPLPWLGVSPSPVTVPVVGEFLRPSPWPHKGFGPAISRFFGRPQAIHS